MVGLRLSLGSSAQDVEVRGLVIAGWAGRDHASVQAHIQELEDVGVPAPSVTPVFYRVSAARLTCQDIEVLGPDSSGEAEAVILKAKGRLWVGIGSDHTDRKAEVHGVALSKQLCDKPVGADFWPLDEVIGHWDDLRLRSYRRVEGERILYQDGTLAELLSPEALVEKWGSELAEGWAMFCGTVAAIGGIRGAETFELELHDPVLSRTLGHIYRAAQLPVVT